MRELSFLVVFSLIFLASCAEELDWWMGGNFYQIYPRSWMDSNGDGIGDLQGIKSKLQYLKDLGMDGVWLSPIFKSPMADHGYDISDFRDIHNEFGTMKDFDELQEECNKLGLKLILDFVPNHSSDEHEWFKKSERREPGFQDFYVWHPGRLNSVTNQRTVPSNWVSQFRYSSWNWSETRQEYYYHKFLDKQPDLNYRSPAVVQEMKDILSFWFNKGVAGFRIDTIPHLFEIDKDENGNYPDEPLSNNPDCGPDDNCYTEKVYTENQEETYDQVYQWRELTEDFKKRHGGDTKILMTESYSELPLTLRYYGDGNREGSHVPFNFEMIMRTRQESNAKVFKDTAESWLRHMPKGYQANWVLGNHDQKRVASRLGVTRGDLINIMLQTLPGVAITYQGEELVMENVHLTWEETQDPQACNSNRTVYEQHSRDPSRTPFPWDDSKNAGFSNASKTWLPVGDKYKTVNVKAQLEAENSHLKIFKKLVQLRKFPVMKSGDYVGVLLNNDNVWVYKREFNNDMVFVILNFGKSQQSVKLMSEFGKAPGQLKVYTSSLDSGFKDNGILNTTSINIKSDNGLVLILTNGPKVSSATKSSVIAILMVSALSLLKFLQ